MDYKLVMVLAATCISISIFASSSISVEARTSSFSTEEEDVKLGKTLGVKTIKTKFGSIYDCVDIHKQPALDHPLLKGHKIQMRPSFVVQERTRNISRSASSKFGSEDECPQGTVPILRMTKEERIRAQSSFTDHFKASVSGFEFAGVSTVRNDAKRYYGAGGYVTIYHPLAENGQFSASMMSIEAGPDDQFSTIRVGWMVNPSAFGDNLTRLYTVWGQGVNGTMHGCYDTSCPGFVVVSSKIQLHSPFDSISTPQYEYFLKLYVTQDRATGNWWLECGRAEGRDIDGDTERLGYWPSSLFTNLKAGGQVLRWGGMVYSDKPRLPSMGSGVSGSYCNFRRLSISDSEAGLQTKFNVPLELEESLCYKVGDNSYKDEYWGYSFWFGGPGQDTNSCHY